jgi:hypothetical protein
MNHPGLDPDLPAALEALAELGPLQVLDVHPTPPRRAAPPSPASAAAGPEQASLFDHAPTPSTSITDPYSHVPPRRRRPVLRHADAALSPTPSTWRNRL